MTPTAWVAWILTAVVWVAWVARAVVLAVRDERTYRPHPLAVALAALESITQPKTTRRRAG